MCGGHSLHKKDWLALGALASLPVAGAFGAGPMAGLLGGSAQATALDALGMGLGAAPGESAAGMAMLGTTAGGAGSTGGVLAGLQAYQKANALAQLAQGGDHAPQSAPMQRPQAATTDPGLADLYSLIYPIKKRKDY